MIWPGLASYNCVVETPMRLFRIEMPMAAPFASWSTSNTEKGRRSIGSTPREAFTITNCPGAAVAAMAGAASASTL